MKQSNLNTKSLIKNKKTKSFNSLIKNKDSKSFVTREEFAKKLSRVDISSVQKKSVISSQGKNKLVRRSGILKGTFNLPLSTEFNASLEDFAEYM